MGAITIDKLADLLRRRNCKLLARFAAVHPRTAARWRDAETEPGALDLIRLMAADVELFAEIARLAGRADAGSAALAAEHLRAALRAIGGEEE